MKKVPRVYEKKYKRYIGELHKEEQVKKNRIKKKYYRIINTFFFVSLIPFFFLLFLYERTFIDLKVILFIYTFVGLISTYMSSNFFNKTEIYKSLLYKLFINILCVGSLFAFILLGVNYLSINDKFIEKQFTILEKGSKASGGNLFNRTPTVDIDYDGMIKTISFYNQESDKIKNATQIKLTLQKGNLGFVIIKSKKIM